MHLDIDNKQGLNMKRWTCLSWFGVTVLSADFPYLWKLVSWAWACLHPRCDQTFTKQVLMCNRRTLITTNSRSLMKLEPYGYISTPRNTLVCGYCIALGTFLPSKVWNQMCLLGARKCRVTVVFLFHQMAKGHVWPMMILWKDQQFLNRAMSLLGYRQIIHCFAIALLSLMGCWWVQ